MSQYQVQPDNRKNGCGGVFLPIALTILGLGLAINGIATFVRPASPEVQPEAVAQIALATNTPEPPPTATRTATPAVVYTLAPANPPTHTPTVTPLPTATPTPTLPPPTATWTPEPPTPTWTPGPTSTATANPLGFNAICEARGSEMTAPQRERHVGQFINQHVTWDGWVYDVNPVYHNWDDYAEYSIGSDWQVSIAMRPRGPFWSRQVVVYGLPNAQAEWLEVEQSVTISGRIVNIEVFFEDLCNPVVIADATLTLR